MQLLITLMHKTYLFTPCPQSDGKERHSKELMGMKKKETRQQDYFAVTATCSHHTDVQREKPQRFSWLWSIY